MVVAVFIVTLLIVINILRLNHARLMEIEQQESRNRARQLNERQGNYNMEYIYACESTHFLANFRW